MFSRGFDSRDGGRRLRASLERTNRRTCTIPLDFNANTLTTGTSRIPSDVQKLLADGLFVASYKFALLRALADLAVLKGDDSGEVMSLDAGEIAETIVELYWRQTRPFRARTAPGELLLRQNTGRQAAIIQTIASAQAEAAGSLARFRRDPDRWAQLVRDVAGVVTEMPLWKLQRIGDEVVDFLYPNVGRGRTITLKPGVAYCLRAFYGLLRNLIEGAWVNYVRTVNRDQLGPSADLGQFLFGTERASLQIYRPILRDLQADQCFYCRQPLRDIGVVDHFIPWSRYPLDLGHNFVLAHSTCNAKKSDHLAAEEHLGAWVEREERDGHVLAQRFTDVQVGHDIEHSLNIARWAYSQTAEWNGLVWVRAAELRHLGVEWQNLLRVA